MSAVSNIEKVHEVSKESKMPESVPSHLKELYDRTGVGMTIEQRNSADTFSKNEQDIGRTGFIRHNIPTGEAHPIKQHLRRVPEAMHKEVDWHVKEMLTTIRS